jgi:Protein of unknown function (DUF3179)
VKRVLSSGLLCLALTASAQTSEDHEWPKTDFSRRTVELAEIESGGPPKDGIPAIDRPRFVGVPAARAWLKGKEPVIVLRMGRDARAYPLQILMYHEIVNDSVNGVPVAVTFCPLCNASIVFERRVGERVLDFGTTGRLRFSDLVMYDRQTESWWQQFTGRGIVGHYAGTGLKKIASEIVSFADFAAAHPTGLVLSRETGYPRPYGRNPYTGYDSIDQSRVLHRSRRRLTRPGVARQASGGASGVPGPGGEKSAARSDVASQRHADADLRQWRAPQRRPADTASGGTAQRPLAALFSMARFPRR